MSETTGQPGAIIIGGSFHSLGAARNLAEHGVEVCVLSTSICVTQFSRRVKRFVRYPATASDEELVDILVGLAAEPDLDGAVVFPSTDDTVRALSLHRDRLGERLRVTVPGWEVTRHLYDKWLTHQLAEASGVPAPRTFNPSGAEDLEALEVEFPLVIKPTVSKRFMAATKKKAYRADDAAQLRELYAQALGVMEPSEILVQELIPGRAENLYSYVGFFRDGVPVAGLAARRLRQHPMEFGRASTYVETVDVPELEELSQQLLSGLGFTGLAEVEFMRDERRDAFVLLEVNPRIWGWHSIAIRAGLDLPYLAYAHAIGHQVEAGRPRAGVKWVRLVTDIPTVLSEMAAGRLSLREYASSMSGDIGDAVFSLRDPLPFLADVVLTPYNYLSNRGF